ncbi:MAG: sigma-54 dependent transcriptional regulator [Pseudomonadales bacterium]
MDLSGNKVVILDDDQQRRSDLQAILNFLKVDHSVSDFVTFLQQEGSQSGYCVALIGRCFLPLSLNKLIDSFRLSYQNTPICLLENWEDSEKLTQTSKRQLLRVLNGKLSEQLLIDILHEAQVYRQVRGAGQGAQEGIFPLIVGQSPRIDKLKQMMSKVVDRDVNVMISGESGTGKELVARSLHVNSSRSSGPFVPVNCGAIPPELLESELFGHEKGAFTGAVSSRSGRFEMANGGTLFLDEIGDIPMPMQVKLLRVLQDRCFERVGGSKTIAVDVRIVTATHKNLESMVAEGSFREDLYYRLNVYPIETPPLRERKSDIEILLRFFCDKAVEQGLGQLRFHSAAIDSLKLHPWDGNVRELSNLVERLAIMYPDGVIGVSELPHKCQHISEPDPSRYLVQNDMPLESDVHFIAALEGMQREEDASPMQLPVEGLDLKHHIEKIETSLIEQALERSGKVVARAAVLLGVRRTTLVEKMKKYGIQRA